MFFILSKQLAFVWCNTSERIHCGSPSSLLNGTHSPLQSRPIRKITNSHCETDMISSLYETKTFHRFVFWIENPVVYKTALVRSTNIRRRTKTVGFWWWIGRFSAQKLMLYLLKMRREYQPHGPYHTVFGSSQHSIHYSSCTSLVSPGQRLISSSVDENLSPQ